MKLLLTALVLALPLCSTAQTVWRCGSDGRIFSDRPCDQGQVVVLADTRPAMPLPEAKAQAEREIRLADGLLAERRAQEALQRGTGLGHIGPQAAALTGHKGRERSPEEARSTKPRARAQRRPEARETWRAVVPASRHAPG